MSCSRRQFEPTITSNASSPCPLFLHCGLGALAADFGDSTNIAVRIGAARAVRSPWGSLAACRQFHFPAPMLFRTNRVVDESKGLFKSEPQPQPKPEPDATPIPKFEREKPPKYVTQPLEGSGKPHAAADQCDSLRRRGTPTVPTTSFAIGAGTTQAGLGFNGAGGGDFGSRFSWYVEAVQRRISSNWLQSTVDPSVALAPRAIVTFHDSARRLRDQYSNHALKQQYFRG